MTPSTSREGAATSRRRVGGAALAAVLWAPVYAPGMMTAGNLLGRAFGIPPSSLGFSLYIAVFVLFVINWMTIRPDLPRMFDADRVMLDETLDLRTKLRALWALSLGRFLVIYAALFVVIAGLSAVF